MKASTEKVPPDGGYGWVVTLAYALNNVVVLPLIASFGLVIQEAFFYTDLTDMQGGLVISLNHGIGMLLSFLVGPVLRRFGYRKVAVVGAILISTGLMITSQATEFWVFILSYSIINSMGVAAVMSAFSLAINSYFKEKRGRAVGAAMSITGLGAIYTPLLMSGLMYAFGWRYAVLILSAICLHSLLAATLLRPAKWYLKEVPVDEEMMPLNKDANEIELINGSVNNSTNIENHQNGPTKSVSMKSLREPCLEKKTTTSQPDLNKQLLEEKTESRYKWWESQEINLGSSVNIFDERGKKIAPIDKPDNIIKEKEVPKGLWKRFVDFFDLTLLTDPIFVNILFGMSMATCVETNFSLMLPLILKDMMKFETGDIANIMAVIGFSDTLSRFISPFIGEWCKKSPRIMYVASLLIIVGIRTIMLFTSSFWGMVVVAFAMGVTKGIRTVYVNIIIPCYVPLERLPYATGIQSFFSGIMIITIGYIMGQLRQNTGSYSTPIAFINVVTLLTVVAWFAEFFYIKINKKKRVVCTNLVPA